jgi:hypothetical protein
VYGPFRLLRLSWADRLLPGIPRPRSGGWYLCCMTVGPVTHLPPLVLFRGVQRCVQRGTAPVALAPGRRPSQTQRQAADDVGRLP